MRRLLTALFLILPALAFAQIAPPTYPNGLNATTNVPTGFTPQLYWCSNNSGYCTTGGDLSGDMYVSDLKVEALISGGYLSVKDVNSGVANGTVSPGTAPSNSNLNGCIYNSPAPTATTGQAGAVQCDAALKTYVDIGADSLGNLPTYLQAVSSGGTLVGSNSYINSASSALATSVKSSAGMVYGFIVANNTAAVLFCRFFNLGVAPTVGTSTPTIRLVIPAGNTQTFETAIGMAFGTGIAFDCTTGSLADSDTTTIGTANTVAVTVNYK